jgi:hypothetical protein
MINLRSQAFREEVGAIKVREDRVPTKEIPQYWTDNPVLRDLRSRSNQLVTGRRGVGKTTLLKKLVLDLTNDLPERRVLPVYVDCNAVRIAAESSIRSQLDTSTLARHLFIQCALAIVVELSAFVDQLSYPTNANPFHAFFTKVLGRRPGDATAKLRETVDNLNEGVLLLDDFSQVDVSDSTENTSEHKQKLGGKVDLGSDSRATFEADRERSTAKKRTSVHSEHRRAIRVMTPKPLLSGLQDIIAQTDLAAIYIILDDVTRISRFSDVQPHFFQYLKDLIPTNTDNVCLKFGAVAQELQMSHGALGLSQVDDVHKIDLDLRIVNLRQHDPGALEAYLRELLYRHLLYRIPNFRLEATGSVESDPALVQFSEPAWKVLFHEPDKCLREIVASAGGNPRDLLATFIYAYDHFLTRSRSSLIEHLDVIEGARFHFLQNKSDEVKQSQYLTAVQEAVADQFIKKTRHPSKVFCVAEPEFKRDDVAWALGELERFRIVSNMGTWQGPTQSYRVFDICTGLVINSIVRSPPSDRQDIQRSFREYEEFCRNARDSVAASILLAQTLSLPAAPATIDVGATRQMLLCMACSNRFAPSHKIFQKHGECPQCGEPVVTVKNQS